MRRDGLPGFQVHFKSPDDPLPVGQVELPGGFRVDGGETVKEHLDAPGLRLLFQPFPHTGGGEGGKIVALNQRVHIKSCAPGDDGGFAPCDNVIHNGGGLGAVAADGEVLVGLRHIDHMMNDALHLLLGGLGGADVHALVNLHGVAGHHFSIQFLCQLHRQGGFPGGSGPGNTDDVVHGVNASR